MTSPIEQYHQQLRIWVVGVRSIERGRGQWDLLWKPTAMEWFGTREACWKYIYEKINKRNFDSMEYKPIRYAPWNGNK